MKTLINQARGICLAVMSFVLAASCGQLDVVGQDSIRAFKELLDAVPAAITTDGQDGGWVLTAPDDRTQFVWSKDYSTSPRYDVFIRFDAQPFVAAGLNPSKLPANITLQGELLLVGTTLGTEKLSSEVKPDPLASYQQIVKLKRSSIGYHGALDHYGVSLGDGNLFEWAKNIKTNDKDLVFVLNPAPFIAAGVDPSRIEGWTFTKVPVDDENGKPVEVDKILKPFNL